MADMHIHPTAVIDENVSIGDGTKIWHFSHVISGSKIGDQCNIGQNVVIGPEVTIGNSCKIQNNVSVYKGVTLEDGVFCGPSMVFTNVYNPRAELRKMDQVRPTLVKKGSTIGANATVVCGTSLGRYSFVGAGAVVTDALAAAGRAGSWHLALVTAVVTAQSALCSMVGERQLAVRAAHGMPAVATKYIGRCTAPVEEQDGLLALVEHIL